MSILLEEFSKYKAVELHLVLIGRSRNIEWEIPAAVSIHIPKWRFNNQKRHWHTVKTLTFIRNTVNMIQPDRILSFGEIWNNLVLLALYGTSFPVYVSDRSTPNKDLGRLQNFLRQKLYSTAAGFIAQTRQAGEVAEKRKWNSNIEVIGNPVPEMPQGAHNQNTVLTVGRLIPTKNVDRLLSMFKSVAEGNIWRLQIIGGNAKRGELLEKYIQQVQDWGWENRIQLLGQQKDIISYYQSAKIFAFTSASEGFPNALAEAMAAGCACIAYDCIAGPADMIDDGINGFLIPMGDEEQYKNKLQLLMEDASLRNRFGKEATKKMEGFEASKIAARFYKIITKDK